MSEQSQDELALVLRRINALSRPAQPSGGKPIDDIPVLTDVYEGADAFSAVEIEQLLAPYYAENEDAEAATQSSPEQTLSPEVDEQQTSGIKFLPADVDEAANELPQEHLFSHPEADNPQLILARQELAEAVIADMQPLISQAIKDALAQEIQALAPRLSAEVEQVLADSLRERVIQALKGD
ncbi:hypothetical protein LG198_05880 [Methylobacillus arboreus]|uniref:hypothetical protein n=1 Tax=Methylobacillus arboreus TaxID=755170 RepID=UPI001E337AC0|nr:hypothetical protein [Methylobacillus arboreus]MCB5190252.1 hypothetical protein [Methylobacillus arboreus]